MHHVIIAAGGTGGHIFPALAMAKALQALDPDIRIHFVGARGGMEERIIPQHGYAQSLLPVGRLNHNVHWSERLLTLLQLPWAVLSAMFLVLKLKPRFVLGVGGHASAPILLAAALLRRRTFIWEPNAMPGLANRWLSRFVDESLVVFPEARMLLKTKKQKDVGMPIRKEIEAVGSAEGVSPSRDEFHILVFGGSQGARGINNAVCEMVNQGGEWLRRVKIVHQTGPYDFERIKAAYGEKAREHVEVKEFLDDMDRRYTWADLVICRSGTGTLSELSACGKPAILIPLPTAADDHQRKNAESIVDAGGAKMILQKDLSANSLRQLVTHLMEAPQVLHTMAQNVRRFHRVNAAEDIGKYLLAESESKRLNP